MPCQPRKRWGRLFLVCGPIVGLQLLLAPADALSNASLVELQGSPVYQSCERYYLEVDSLKAEGRHYLIKDASAEFVIEVKTLKPRTKPEAFLLMECLNLANGNGQLAIDEIRRIEAEDDDIIRMALDDASNKSNAAGYELNSDLEAKYDLATDVEFGVESYRSAVREARALALQHTAELFGEITLTFDEVGYRSGTGIYGTTYNASLAGFAAIAQLASQAFMSFSGSGMAATSGGQTIAPAGSSVTLATAATSPAWSNTGGNWTPPPTPPTAGQSPGSTAVAPNTSGAFDPTAPATAGEDSLLVSSGTAATAVAALPSAPKLDAACLDFRVTRQDVSFASVANGCSAPVSFYWCWVEAGQKACAPAYLSEIVEPGGVVEIAGPSAGQTQTANFVVCNMITPDHVCER